MLTFLFILLLIACLFSLTGKLVGELISPTHSLEQRLALLVDPTDEQYLARTPSDISPEVALGVRRILVDVGGVEADEVWPETSLTDLLE